MGQAVLRGHSPPQERVVARRCHQSAAERCFQGGEPPRVHRRPLEPGGIALTMKTRRRGASIGRRSRERGAVMLEAVMVAFFLIIVFGCVVGSALVYRAKLRAMQDS